MDVVRSHGLISIPKNDEPESPPNKMSIHTHQPPLTSLTLKTSTSRESSAHTHTHTQHTTTPAPHHYCCNNNHSSLLSEKSIRIKLTKSFVVSSRKKVQVEPMSLTTMEEPTTSPPPVNSLFEASKVLPGKCPFDLTPSNITDYCCG